MEVQKRKKREQKRTRLGSTLCGKWLRACHGNLHFQLDKGYVGLCRPPGARPTYIQLASPGCSLACNLTRSRRCGAAAAVNMQTGIFFCGFDFTQVSPTRRSPHPRLIFNFMFNNLPMPGQYLPAGMDRLCLDPSYTRTHKQPANQIRRGTAFNRLSNIATLPTM